MRWQIETLPGNFQQAAWPALLSLGYVSLFSMLLGFSSGIVA